MMNYEVKPFQDYGLVTIDELKEQTASLLNLVTEEQRPLCVCMNNSKEFLLFPQDLLAPVCDSDFRLILLSAMRYAMGRNTYMPAVVSDYIKRIFGFWTISFLRWLPMISRCVFVKKCAIRIDKQQKERYNNVVIDNDVII